MLRGEGGWTLKRGFHTGFHMQGPVSPDRGYHNQIGSISNFRQTFSDRFEQNFTCCGKNKAKVIYGTQRSAPPAFASLADLALKISGLDAFAYKKQGKTLSLHLGTVPLPIPGKKLLI